ncbi:MAG: hypothetical protein MJ211_06260 [Bacteroidales bacterium]|nr:hypothetical protein [Bacteroidales bacterium]
MKIKILICFFINILLFTSCLDLTTSDDEQEENSENCTCKRTTKPEDEEVELKLSLNNQNKQVEITIYEGSIDKNKIVKTYIAEETPAKIVLDVDKNYTYVAKYLKGIDTIYVPVNSDLSTHKYTCNEEPCWRIKNNVINLKLKI